MKASIKILTNDCCNNLLRFTSDNKLREMYNSDKFDFNYLKFLPHKTQYKFENDIELNLSSKDDSQNSRKIFLQLINLDKVQANDKRLWVCLTHTVFYKYTRLRWDINQSTSNEKIIERFHFEGSSLSSRMGNSISRLWWAAKITYKEESDKPFELTDLLWERQDIITSLVERRFGTYKNVLHGFLEVYCENKHLKENEIRILAKGLNALGGVKVLPSLDKAKIKEELRRISDFHKIQIN